jgi:hypothetical protein
VPTTGDFGDHLRAGNQMFSPTDDELRDLTAFLRTIDDDTETIAVPDDGYFQNCRPSLLGRRRFFDRACVCRCTASRLTLEP